MGEERFVVVCNPLEKQNEERRRQISIFKREKDKQIRQRAVVSVLGKWGCLRL